ncbi:unnamed protein product [Arabis nemorensis]|uniref:Uncharacterized protein n=1 Tax=Arabis nemorensis TaxID=586526 RepID=A0A565C7D1_9BRAS|nr:unnamed protein product [Arabis nemorensis]
MAKAFLFLFCERVFFRDPFFSSQNCFVTSHCTSAEDSGYTRGRYLSRHSAYWEHVLAFHSPVPEFLNSQRNFELSVCIIPPAKVALKFFSTRSYLYHMVWSYFLGYHVAHVEHVMLTD